MFCSQCGTKNQMEARFCQICGNSLSDTHSQSTPTSTSTNNESAIWNPNAAANWSLLFSPAFGSYIQMLNWRTLGEPEKAASSQNWFYASLGMLAISVLIGILAEDSKTVDGATRGLGFIFLLVWYFSAGREQGKYVKEKIGSNYSKKPWGKALLIGVAAFIGFLISAMIVGFVLGIVLA